MSTIIQAFDYTALAPDVELEARTIARCIKETMRNSIIEVGAALASVKGKLPHGQFGRWLEAEFDMTTRSAQHYMAAAALAGKYEKVAHLGQSCLYLLAATTTPEVVREDVAARLDKGEVLRRRDIKQLVDEVKYQQQQEQRRAEEAAREARLSPQTRRRRADQRAEREQREREWQQQRDRKQEAAKAAASLLTANVAAGDADRLIALLGDCDAFRLTQLLLDKLTERGVR
ncbi:MAG: DUF3102 domain-containing protein [Alphaproteobacteria bacterium]|nr:DUF3102 domain-containing protein [Alphaproteobacteria bacterium]